MVGDEAVFELNGKVNTWNVMEKSLFGRVLWLWVHFRPFLFDDNVSPQSCFDIVNEEILQTLDL